MYGFGEQLDWRTFEGRVLEGVSFSESTVSFYFSGELAVTLEGPGSLRLVGRPAESIGAKHRSQLPLIVGQRVSDVSWASDRLILSFRSGDRVTFLDDSELYESLSVRIGDAEFYV